jgi:hypothetical protein
LSTAQQQKAQRDSWLQENSINKEAYGVFRKTYGKNQTFYTLAIP